MANKGASFPKTRSSRPAQISLGLGRPPIITLNWSRRLLAAVPFDSHAATPAGFPAPSTNSLSHHRALSAQPLSRLRRLEIPRALLRRSPGNCCLALLSSLIHPASCVCVNHGRLAGTWSQLFCLSFETMALLISVFTCLSFAFLFSLIYLFQSQMLLLLLSIIVS